MSYKKIVVKNNLEVKCCCGLDIDLDNIYYTNLTTELGEAYYKGMATCNCSKEYEWFEWGECDSILEATDDLNGYIKLNYDF